MEGIEEILPHVDILLPNERERRRSPGLTIWKTALSQLAQKGADVVVKMVPPERCGSGWPTVQRHPPFP